MFKPARKTMPAIDYVSIVKSVYTDRRAMVMGALACLIGTAVTAFKTGSPVLWTIAGCFILVTIYRYIDMTMFARDDVGPTDVAKAAKWEVRVTYGATMFAFLCGAWCFSTLVFVNDSTAELISMVVTVSCMVGIVTRNFGLDRLLSIQLVIVLAMISAGLFIKGNSYHWFLSVVMLIILISYRKLAADVRAVLLNAVHSRVEATDLAGQLDTALDTMQHGLCMLDEFGVVAVANDRAAATLSGLAPGSWIGRPFEELLDTAANSGELPRTAANRLQDLVTRGVGGKVLLSFVRGQYFEVTVSSRENRTVLLFEDITERVKAEERINFMARYDSLTGLPNRAYFTELVSADLEQRRSEGSADEATVMIIDIDDFKHVNDTMGHLVGDRLLGETAARLREALPPSSMLARLGGDEFIVYGASASSEAALTQAEAVLIAFQKPFGLASETLMANVSIGIVTSRRSDDDLDTLMTKADLALYQAKGNGKAQAKIFHEDMDTEYRYRQKLKAELRLAVAEGGLTLAYQPIIDLRSRHVVGCEALARWRHPTLGNIPPSLFIPIAEETGLISDISRWVLQTATLECCNWPEEVSVAVNISARDFRSGDVPAMVSAALRSSGLAAERLEIEVTETAVIEEREVATQILTELAAQGIGIALDDFGTGYSSLSYLQAFPFSKLKIDRSFVADLATNPRSLKLLTNVAQLGKDINLTVTAEGIETEDQLALISQHTKVDQIQGYLFGVPLPARDVGELIHRMAAATDMAEPKRKLG